MDLRTRRISMARAFPTPISTPKKVVVSPQELLILDDVDGVALLLAPTGKSKTKLPLGLNSLSSLYLKNRIKLYERLLASSKTNSKPLKGSKKEGGTQFGLDLTSDSLLRVQLSRYSAPIPVVLIALKQELMKKGGLKEEGVFRVTASRSKLKVYKDQLDEGTFLSCEDGDTVCMAGLIKEWFRSLPTPLMNEVGLDAIRKAAISEESDKVVVSALFAKMQEPNRAVLSWFLDLLIMADQYKDENKMSIKNLATVVAPSLYTIQEQLPPAQIMNTINALVETVHRMLKYRKAMQPSLAV